MFQYRKKRRTNTGDKWDNRSHTHTLSLSLFPYLPHYFSIINWLWCDNETKKKLRFQWNAQAAIGFMWLVHNSFRLVLVGSSTPKNHPFVFVVTLQFIWEKLLYSSFVSNLNVSRVVRQSIGRCWILISSSYNHHFNAFDFRIKEKRE